MTAPMVQLPTQTRAGDPFDASKMTPPVNRGCKPGAWLWTSTWTPDNDHPSDWLRWCDEASFDDWTRPDAEVALIEVGPARVFTIDGLDALMRFVSRAVRRDGRYPGSLDDYNLDWTATTRAWDADALRVTAEGHESTRWTMPFSTYAWDCESTAWVNRPTILSVRTLGEVLA
jgi:hypothetical protein